MLSRLRCGRDSLFFSLSLLFFLSFGIYLGGDRMNWGVEKIMEIGLTGDWVLSSCGIYL